MKYARKDPGHDKEKSPKQDLTCDGDLTIELPEGREFPYQIID